MQVGSIESACQKDLKARLPVFSEEVSQAEARKINGQSGSSVIVQPAGPSLVFFSL